MCYLHGKGEILGMNNVETEDNNTVVVIGLVLVSSL